MNKIVKLGEVCDLQNGFAFKSSDYVEKSNTLNIRMSNIRLDGSFNEMHKAKYLPDSYAEKYKEFSLKDGDLIIAMTDMAGDPKILGLPSLIKNLNGRTFLLNQRVGKLHKFSEKIYVPYLCYFLKTLKEYYKKKGAGGLQINISKNEILSASIVLCPLAEQQRIVAKLDDSFAEIDKAINVAKHKKEEADILRQGILVKELKIDGDVKKLSDVSQINNGGTPDSKNKLYWGDNNHWLTPKDMGKLSSHHVDASERQITDEGLNNSSAKLVPQNSVILSCRAPIGYLAINSVPMSFNQGCKGLVPKPNLLAKYLYYFLLSSKQLLNDLGSGTTFKEISSKTLSNVIINIPSLIEQKRIVVKLDLTFAEVKKIKSYTEKQIVNYQTLKSVILTKELQKEAA